MSKTEGEALSKQPTVEGDNDVMVEVRQLCKAYGKFEAVKSLSFAVRRGEVFGFLGPNGAGKTTTLRMITGLLQPTSGSIEIGGVSMLTSPLEAKALIGFIPDRPYLYEKLTAVEFMRFVASLHKMGRVDAAERIASLLALFELTPWGGRLIENFSHGMKQRLVVATALLPRGANEEAIRAARAAPAEE